MFGDGDIDFSTGHRTRLRKIDYRRANVQWSSAGTAAWRQSRLGRRLNSSMGWEWGKKADFHAYRQTSHNACRSIVTLLL